MLTKLRKLPGVTEVKSRAADRPRVSRASSSTSSASARCASTPDAADFLVQAVGQDLRSLSAAASQLANDFERSAADDRDGQEVLRRPGGGEVVRGGRPRALRADGPKALEELRWALDRGTAPVLVTSAMAGGLRSLAKFMRAPRGMRDTDLMREVGVPALEARHAARAVARLGRRRHRPGDPGGGPRRRRRQGAGQRPVLRPGADGARRRPAAQRPQAGA